jgi:dihydrofolate synthase / folylpolyglutamate synthase
MPSRASSLESATAWVGSLSPWPETFGLERIEALLERLGHPEHSFDSIHVVGSNGKSTATRTIAELLRAEGRRAGAYTSPHVSGWAERIWVDGEHADFERAVARVRADAEAVGATQFETVTAAAFAEFATQDVEVAVIEAGLGGRLDATNVVAAPVVLLTNVAREHTEVLGETPEEIAREKLAVGHAARVVVLPDNTFAPLVPGSPISIGGPRQAAEAYLGRAIERDLDVQLPGRLERRGENPVELWDGAHNLAGAEFLLGRLERTDFIVCASILADKNVDAMLATFARAGRHLIATQSSNPRALPARDLAASGQPYFDYVAAIPKPGAARARAVELAGTDGAVLITGSLYLLAELSPSD